MLFKNISIVKMELKEGVRPALSLYFASLDTETEAYFLFQCRGAAPGGPLIGRGQTLDKKFPQSRSPF